MVVRPDPNPNTAYRSSRAWPVVAVVPDTIDALEPGVLVATSSSGDASMSSQASACIAHRERVPPEMVTVMMSPAVSAVVTRHRITATATVVPALAETSGVVV